MKKLRFCWPANKAGLIALGLNFDFFVLSGFDDKSEYIEIEVEKLLSEAKRRVTEIETQLREKGVHYQILVDGIPLFDYAILMEATATAEQLL